MYRAKMTLQMRRPLIVLAMLAPVLALLAFLLPRLSPVPLRAGPAPRSAVGSGQAHGPLRDTDGQGSFHLRVNPLLRLTALAMPADGPYLHADRGVLRDAQGHLVRLSGINWFGLETCAFAPEGLGVRTWWDMLDQVRALGFNIIRLPFSDQLLDPTSYPRGINYALNPDLRGLSGLQLMDRIVEGAGQRGLRVILDRHRPDCAAQSPLWYTQRYPEQRWIADLVFLALRYRHEPAVIGIDLHNEPHGQATWGDGNPATDWRLAAERAGNAVLRANPHLLIVVQGVQAYRGDYYWWGGNLEGAAKAPVRLVVPYRLVYEVHDYGAGVFRQGWFEASNFPRNLPAIWLQHWAYLPESKTAPLLVGEFGGRNVALPYEPTAVRSGARTAFALTSAEEDIWQRTLVRYLSQHRAISFAYWSLTPDSSDTGGLLTDDWQTANSTKEQLLAGIQAAALPLPRARPAPAPLRVLASNSIAKDGKQQTLTLRIVNDGSQRLNLTHVELRYWMNASAPLTTTGQQRLTRADWATTGVDWASIGPSTVVTRPSLDHGYPFVALRFVAAPLAQETLAPYGGVAKVALRLSRPDWAPYVLDRAWSYTSSVVPVPEPHLTLTVDGRRVWGASPLRQALVR